MVTGDQGPFSKQTGVCKPPRHLSPHLALTEAGISLHCTLTYAIFPGDSRKGSSYFQASAKKNVPIEMCQRGLQQKSFEKLQVFCLQKTEASAAAKASAFKASTEHRYGSASLPALHYKQQSLFQRQLKYADLLSEWKGCDIHHCFLTSSLLVLPHTVQPPALVPEVHNPACTHSNSHLSPATHLHRISREVPHEIGLVRIVHHGNHGEGISSKAKKLVNILLARNLVACGHFAADFIISCRRKENERHKLQQSKL